MKHLSITFFLMSLIACATPPKPERAPVLHVDQLPKITTSRIKPKALMVEVANLREVNQKAGNSEQVATVVSDALTQLVQNSGYSLGKTRNLLRAELLDCPPMKDSEGENISASVCLKIKIKVITPAFTYEGSATSQNYRGGFNPQGDVSDAYQSALELVIKGMNEKLAE